MAWRNESHSRPVRCADRTATSERPGPDPRDSHDGAETEIRRIPPKAGRRKKTQRPEITRQLQCVCQCARVSDKKNARTSNQSPYRHSSVAQVDQSPDARALF